VHDLFVLTCAATVGSIIATWMQAPNIIGFLVGGIVVGPGGLDLIAELVQIESLAELGVCLLLFCIGMEVSIKQLVSNIRAALAAVVSMVLLVSAVMLFANFLTKTSLFEALCIGVYASLASTPLSLRAVPKNVAADRHQGDGPSTAAQGDASQLLTILVTQDIILAGLLASMPAIFRPAASEETRSAPMPPTTTTTRHHSAAAGAMEADLEEDSSHLFLSITLVVFGLLLAVLLCWRGCRRKTRRGLAKAKDRFETTLGAIEDESFTLLILAYAFTLSWLTDSFGLSVELGAFLAGFALRTFSREVSNRAEHTIGGLRDTFVAWFFASIGLVVNPYFLLDNMRSMLSVVVFIFVLKLVTGWLPLWLFSARGSAAPAFDAFRASWILAHVSEFGFVLASKGKAWGVLSRHVYLLLIGANAVSLCLAPWLFRLREVILPNDTAGYQCPAEQGPADSNDESPLQKKSRHTVPTTSPSAAKMGKARVSDDEKDVDGGV